MLIGIGTDIFKMSHLHAEYLNPSDPFVQQTYTKREVEEAGLRDVPLYYFATRFAGKEAVFKALNRDADKVKLKEIEILNRASGQPFVRLHGRLKEDAEKAGIGRVMISLSYDTEYAVAYAAAVSRDEGEERNEE